MKATKGKKESIKLSYAKANEDLYKNILLNEVIYLKPSDLNCKINDIILMKLKKKVEGRCLKVGFIMKDSVKIQSRSLGMINNASFDGMTSYKLTYTADVCNPVIGQIIQCQVGNIDKSQTICYLEDQPNNSPIEIYLFKHHHIGNQEFDELKKGDIINIKIVGSKWEYRDVQISSIAQFIGKAII
jgi:DNA-directed RNA polymerase subunit E'/Rpb7